jgi:ZIP family zinc transporter
MEFPAHIIFAFVLTVIAGLSTGIGSLIAYFIRTPKMIYLSFSLGFSAGVMIYVSFVELLPQAVAQIGQLSGIIVFFLGGPSDRLHRHGHPGSSKPPSLQGHAS